MLGRRPRRSAGAAQPPRAPVLAAMAEGKSNVGIAETLFISEAAVEKHITAIFRKLEHRHRRATEHRRVHAVLTYLRQGQRRG